MSKNRNKGQSKQWQSKDSLGSMSNKGTSQRSSGSSNEIDSGYTQKRSPQNQ